MSIVCGKPECSKSVSCKNPNAVRCCFCQKNFHAKCSLSTRDYMVLISNNIDFYCNSCRNSIFPFNNIETSDDLFNIFNDTPTNSLACKKCKCGFCKKIIKINTPAAHCSECLNYFHLKCEGLCKNDFPI